ncbi:MAG: DHHA1 domain-containing protein [Candidatus Eisenbacteria bacterium]|nr:DHHA1 domain-containing protein [Candidatus Eisenbacteria bacterium]
MDGLTKTAAESRRKILEALEGPGPFVIASHGRPDGDALGSALALKLWLEGRGRRAEVVNSDGVPDPFGFLPSADRVLLEVPHDLIGCTVVVLDTPVTSRAALADDVLSRADLVVNIDHHPDNTRYGDLDLVDPSASSVALIIYELLADTGEFSVAISSLLYTGAMTDTGGFRFGNTDARTLRAAAELVALGASPAGLANAVYGEQPLGRLRLLGLILSTTETEFDGKVAISVLTERMKRDTGSTGEDIEGMASFGRLIRGVEVALLLREENGSVRASLRSKGAVDVNAVARRLGGGGHKAAAGVRLEGSIESARERLLEAVAETMVGEDV